MLDLSDRLIVIIGGGAVAARKAAGVLAADAREVRVVAPDLTAALPAGVTHIQERYEPRHLDGAGLVFAATDSAEVNRSVVGDARAAGVLVSRVDVDESDAGDFTVPAVLRRGEITVAVSASGAPALAATVRDYFDLALDDRWTKLAAATQSLRPLIVARIADLTRRRDALRDLASNAALVLVDRGEEPLRDWLAARYPELK